MNPLLAKTVAFSLGCAMAAVFWAPDKPPSEPLPENAPKSRASHRELFNLGSALTAAGAASSPADQAAAARRLAHIPADQIAEALETAILVENRQLTLVAKTLLVRWGETDGEAAMHWAWQQLRGDGLWRQAFHQIGAAWAWSDPQAFGEWASRTMDQRASRSLVPTDDEDSESPQLAFDMINRACRWLALHDPQLASRLLKQRGGFSSEDGKFAQYFSTADQVREALTAFENLDQLTPWRLDGSQILPHSLLRRWAELDPEDFEGSPYRSVLTTSASQQVEERTTTWSEEPEAGRAAAAEHLLTTSEPTHRPRQLVQLTTEWTKRDPQAAAEWIDSLPAADRRPALRSHARVRAAADLEDAVDWIAGLPSNDQPFCLATAFDTWNSQPAAGRPDHSTWPQSLRQGWSDLEALQPEPTE